LKTNRNVLTEIDVSHLSTIMTYLQSMFSTSLLLKAKKVFWFYTWNMDLALLYSYSCNFEFSANMAFCHEWTANFPIFSPEKLTAQATTQVNMC